jgi:sec-independent protein translocase protein TatC
MINIVVPVAVLFELPVVVMFLTKLRILNPFRLKKLRRYAYFILVVLSTLIAPPDLISNILIIIPLFLLYELSVWLSRRIYRKQLAADKAWEAEYGTK